MQNVRKEDRAEVFFDINKLLRKSWGDFPRSFVFRHVLTAQVLTVVWNKKRLIGFCAINQKEINQRKVIYAEFLIIDPKFQGQSIAPKLFFRALIKLLGLKAIKIIYKPIEIFFITPNIRVLSLFSRYAAFIYPDLTKIDKNGAIPKADYETWCMAREIVKKSEMPYRKLEREGLILHGSYSSSPWLRYSEEMPWHRKSKLNVFAKRYLKYGKGSDLEIIVRGKITFSSLLKYLLSSG
jgi:hypothetical protein